MRGYQPEAGFDLTRELFVLESGEVLNWRQREPLVALDADMLAAMSMRLGLLEWSEPLPPLLRDISSLVP